MKQNKSYYEVDPYEVQENVERRNNKKKKELEELANIELSLDASGNVEEVEERMKQVEARVLDRLSLLEERLTDALLKKKSAF